MTFPPFKVIPNSYRSILRCLVIIAMTAWLTVACHLPAQSQSNALSLALEAQQLYDRGKLTRSAAMWQEAATAFRQQDDRLGEVKSSISQSQVLQDLGLYPRACDLLLEALNGESYSCSTQNIENLIQFFAAKTRITTVESIGLRSLANILQRQGKLQQAQTLLQLAISATQKPAELNSALLSLGNVRQALGNRSRDRWNYDRIAEIIARQNPQLALEPYLTAFVTYEKIYERPSTALITQVQAQLNHLSLLIDIEDWWQQQIKQRTQSWQQLDRARLLETANNFFALLSARLDRTQTKLVTAIDCNLPKLAPSRATIYAQIDYARSLTRLGQSDRIESVLKNAWQQSVAIEDKLGESYALGYLGQYYNERGQLSKAIALTNRALILAEAESINGETREISYLWQSQLGKLLQQAGKTDEAIAAYSQAFNTLQSLRTDLNANERLVQFDFRQEVMPVYLQLANLLLSTENSSQVKSLNALNINAASNQSNLELARQVIESLQIAELDNFFQDPCLSTVERTVTIDEIDPQAAVIYPIILSDRLEILLSISGKPLQRFTVDVSASTVELSLNLIRDSLFNPSINNSAINIFSTTFVNPQEVAENMQTLLPTLQQVYGWLVQPLENALATEQIKTLVFVPNGKLQNLPIAALYDGKQYLLEKYSVALAPSLQLLNNKTTSRSQIKVLAAGLSKQVEIQGKIFPALENVPEELNQIETIFPQSQLLLNRDFTASSIERQIKAGFPVVHLATHGVFSSDPQQTFIVTGDRQTIDINTLSNLLNASSTKPELVVLSACDTATGDERAVLGLAGVTVRSGSTTLASLWSVDDASTARLMSQFYREFQNPATKKVDALQKAQLSSIESLRANPPIAELKHLPPHPYYWAAYVLVGNWQ